MPRSLIQVSNAGSASSIVAMSSTPRTSGPSPSPASCTLPLWVRIRALHESAVTLWTNIVSAATGTLFIYGGTQMSGSGQITLAYFSISLSLNVLLTLMIVIRLIRHARNTRTALRIGGIGGLCKAVVTMLVESCALFAVSSLLVIGTDAANNDIHNFFADLLSQAQVRASPWPQSPDRLTDWAGHRTTAHHSTSRE